MALLPSPPDTTGNTSADSGFALGSVGEVLIVTLQSDLTERVLRTLGDAVLERLKLQARQGVVFDLSGLGLLDLTEFEALRQLARMVGVMGARAAFVGFSPGIVSLLVDMDADTDGVVVMPGMDEALALLGRAAR